jgi:hypothetical protein
MSIDKFVIRVNGALGVLFLGVFALLSYSVFQFGDSYNFEMGGRLTSNKLFMLVASSALAVGSLGWGLCSHAFRTRNWVTNVNLILISALVISPLLGEIFLRLGIGANISYLRNPELYADAYSEDDYWKLELLWSGRSPQLGDPLLGWSDSSSVQPISVKKADVQRVPLLFFGDSFVAGSGETVPYYLDRLLSTHDVYNYGISGYGVDQIYLRFKEEHSTFASPTVLFGILTLDLDRSILNFRSMPKPRFIIKDDQLELTNVPIPAIPARAWVEAHPPEIRSYYFSLLFRLMDLVGANLDDKIVNNKLEEKQVLNREILAAALREATEHDIRLVFVLFYSPLEIHTLGWRERFLKETLEDLGAPYIDSKAFVLASVQETGAKVSEYYNETEHHNTRANEVIAEGIARELGRRFSSSSP